MVLGVFEIAGRDYAPYVKEKNGLQWSRENTNDEDAGRDAAYTMHTNVTSHQRKLELKMGPMPYDVAMQLEADLEAGDEGVLVRYPDLKDGICTRLFYNTSISAAMVRFTDEGIRLDDISFTLISVKEETA